jgi:outer membrane protein assembly factor BamB
MTPPAFRPARRVTAALALPLFVFLASPSHADDWPQWRGVNRDGKVTGFTAPKAWPKELTKKWTVTVGDGVATPALVGDKLYVFSRQGGDEVIRCLDAGTGKEVWIDKYPAAAVQGPAGGFPGPRASPAVADGKVVTLGVDGTLSALDAATGKKAWRVETKGRPKFYTSSSPVIAGNLAVAQFGGEGTGGVAAYDLATGQEKWKWAEEGTAYASPVLMDIGGTKMLVAETDRSIVGLGLGDGKLLWQTPFPLGGGKGGGKGKGGGGYNASTPVVVGDTVIFSGSNRGTRAVKVEKSGNTFAARELWNNPENSVIYNTPVVSGKLVYGLAANNNLYAVSAETGKTAWTAGVKGKGGYGSIVDAGPVLFSLTPAAQLVVFKPGDKDFDELASYRVANSETYAYPVIAGNRIYIKDRDSVTLWAIE